MKKLNNQPKIERKADSIPSSKPQISVPLPPAVELPRPPISVKVEKTEDIAKKQYNEAKTMVFLIENMCLQNNVTPEFLDLLFRILSDLKETSMNPIFQAYLTKLISKVQSLKGL